MSNKFLISKFSAFVCSMALAASATAASNETANLLKCSMKISHAGEKIQNSQALDIQLQLQDSNAEITVKDNQSGQSLDVSVVAKEKLAGLYGISIIHWPKDTSTHDETSSGSLLLFSEGTLAEVSDPASIISPVGNPSDIYLSLHTIARMDADLVALYFTKTTLKVLRDAGYKGSSIVWNYLQYNEIDKLVAGAVAKNKLKKSDIVLFGLNTNCSITQK